jgi:hypothetical protein
VTKKIKKMEGLQCVAGWSLFMLITHLVSVTVFICIVEWRHVAWEPLNDWFAGLWRLRTLTQADTHFELLFASILPRIQGQRIYGTWLELKRWGWKLILATFVFQLGLALRMVSQC